MVCKNANPAVIQQSPFPLPNELSCLRNLGTKDLCNQTQVLEFPETVLVKSWVEITPEIVCRGHLEGFS